MLHSTTDEQFNEIHEEEQKKSKEKSTESEPERLEMRREILVLILNMVGCFQSLLNISWVGRGLFPLLKAFLRYTLGQMVTA